MIFKIIEPCTEKEFDRYFDLRWSVLRAPWKQPKGTEKDDLESKSIHLMATDDAGRAVGVGRLAFLQEKRAQIDYMAVWQKHRRKGVGGMILKTLEQRAKEHDISLLRVNARTQARLFYENHGYRVVRRGKRLFGCIPHLIMEKKLKLGPD